MLQESGVQSRLDTTPTLTPLVGRKSEITLLLDRWEQARAGQGQVVVLRGEAGIGKSRLVHVLKDHVAQGVHTRLECRSSPYYQNTALYPIIDLVERGAGFHRDDSPPVKLDKLEHTLSQYQRPLKETVPLFATLLLLPIPDNRYPSLNLSLPQQRQKTLETTVTLLLELAERHPLLFIVEDLHWTDPTTLEFLDLLLSQTPTRSLLILLTCRPEFQSPWGQRSYLTGVTLNRLTNPQVEQVIERLTDGTSLPAEVVQQIVDKTDGVPLFVEEMIKALLESGDLQATNGYYELTGPLHALAIPTTLQDALTARLDRLVTAKGIAQMGATIGRQFTYELLRAVATVDETVLRHDLGVLVAAELIYQRGVPPHSTYLFKHALIQDAAYQSLLHRTRRQYHQRIAEVLAAQFPATRESHPELLAHHYMEAGLPKQAFQYWYKAGQQVATRSANREAVACFEQALLALWQLPNSREWLKRELALQFALRETLFPLREFDRSLACLQEAERLAEDLDDYLSLGRILCYQGLHAWLVQNDHVQALNVCQRALKIAEALQDIPLLALARDNLGRTHFSLGAYTQAMEVYTQNIELLTGDLERQRFGMALFLSVSARRFYSQCCAEVGMFADGQQRTDEAIRIAEAEAHPHSLIIANYGAGWLALRQGRLPHAIATLERAVAVCREADIPLLFNYPLAPLGAAYALTGRLTEALELQAQAVAQPDTEYAPAMVLMGETYLLAGRLEEAVQCARQALEHARRQHEQSYEAYALRLLGEIAMHRHPLESDQAEIDYQQALGLAEDLGMRPLMAHCHRGLGEVHMQKDQLEQARAQLSISIDMYRDMEITFWLPQAEIELAKIER